MRSGFAIGALVAFASAYEQNASALQVTELIDGILIGALKTEHVDNLETCIKDFNPLVTDMETAVADFEDGSYTKIADGVYQLGQFISQVGVVLEDCPQVGASDVAKLKQMGDAFLHPKKLVIDAFHNVEVNGVQIYKDIRKAGKDIDNNQWEAAGELYGTVAATVLYGAVASMDQPAHSAHEFQKTPYGYYDEIEALEEPAEPEHVQNHVNTCSDDFYTAAATLGQAAVAYADGTYQAKAASVHLLGEAIDQFGVVMKNCADDEQELKELGQTVALQMIRDYSMQYLINAAGHAFQQRRQ